MSVIINEFEIVTDATSKPAPESKAEESQAAPLSPQDIRSMIVYQAERMARIRAH